MTTRSSSRSITFAHPFQLPGMTAPHPAGTFELQVQEEQLDVMWEAYRQTMTLMLTSRGAVEAWPVTAEELKTVQDNDLQQNASTGHS
jgi:hypothetical protein